MACKVYEQLRSEEEPGRREYAYFTYPENRMLCGVSDLEAKRRAKVALQRSTQKSNEMSWHRKNCADCKTDAEA
jgi:hypothetical protein